MQSGPVKQRIQSQRPMVRDLLSFAVFACGLAFLLGCDSLRLPSDSPSSPFLFPTSEDRMQLAIRASELDVLAAECAEESTCNEQVHFARALISLFENREAARASFEKVISINPSGSLANSSTLWLELLRDEAHQSNVSYHPLLVELTKQYVRQWTAHPLRGRSTPELTVDRAKPEIVQALHKQVRERDRHIAHLRAQLDALKVINQDQEARRTLRPPASLMPKLDTSR
jgi:hypothetical protein